MKDCDNSKIHISSNFILFICLLIKGVPIATVTTLLERSSVLCGVRAETEETVS